MLSEGIDPTTTLMKVPSIFAALILFSACNSTNSPGSSADFHNPGIGSVFHYTMEGYTNGVIDTSYLYTRTVSASDLSWQGRDHVFRYESSSDFQGSYYRRDFSNGDYDWYQYFNFSIDTQWDYFGTWARYPLSSAPGHYVVLQLDTTINATLMHWGVAIDILGSETQTVNGLPVPVTHFIETDSSGDMGNQTYLLRKTESWYAPSLGMNIKNITGVHPARSGLLDSMTSFTLQ